MIREWVSRVFFWLLDGGLLLLVWLFTVVVAVQVGRWWGRREQARWAVAAVVKDATVGLVPAQRGGER